MNKPFNIININEIHNHKFNQWPWPWKNQNVLNNFSQRNSMLKIFIFCTIKLSILPFISIINRVMQKMTHWNATNEKRSDVHMSFQQMKKNPNFWMISTSVFLVFVTCGWPSQCLHEHVFGRLSSPSRSNIFFKCPRFSPDTATFPAIPIFKTPFRTRKCNDIRSIFFSVVNLSWFCTAVGGKLWIISSLAFIFVCETSLPRILKSSQALWGS